MSQNKIVLLKLKDKEFVLSNNINTTSIENNYKLFWTEAKLLVSLNLYHLVYYRYA